MIRQLSSGSHIDIGPGWKQKSQMLVSSHQVPPYHSLGLAQNPMTRLCVSLPEWWW